MRVVLGCLRMRMRLLIHDAIVRGNAHVSMPTMLSVHHACTLMSAPTIVEVVVAVVATAAFVHVVDV
eukprot:6645091-Lingulodinium_polyedra.AAC.1